MNEENDEEEQTGLYRPLLWGFLTTFLLGILGVFGLMLGAWPLLWLPLLAPVFAFLYMRLMLHNDAGFGRFLAGYGICLTLFIVLMVLFIAVVL
jgi:hypothetical protein